MSRLLTFVVALVLLLGAQPVFAQEGIVTETETEDQPIRTVITTGGQNNDSPLQCFDSYKFNSVVIDIETPVFETSAGAKMTFSGTAENQNSYPLTDVTLVAKVFKTNETWVQNGHGNQVVDQFVIDENVSMGAEEIKNLTFEWEVPTYAESGEYFVTVYVLNADFAMTGLLFSDDVYANTSYFSVAENDNVVVYLDKNNTSINGEAYRFVDFPPRINATSSQTLVSTQLVNPTDEEMVVPLQWQQYSFDASKEENLRNTKTELVRLGAGESKEVAYTVKEDRASVVYVTATTEDRGVKNILNIRFVQEGKTLVRFSHLGLSTFPVESNSEVTMTACAHSTGETVDGTTITLTLTDDRTGVEAFRYTYNGQIDSSVGGYGEKFTSDSVMDKVTLTATLEREGVVVESTKVVYDCADIPGLTCTQPESTSGTLFEKLINNPVVFYSGIIVLLGLLYLVFSVHRRHSGKNSINKMNHDDGTITSLALSLAFVIGIGFLFGSTATVQAKTVSATGVATGNTSGGYMFTRFEADYTVLYRANLYNQQTGALINDGATLQAGTIVELRPGSRSGNGVRTSDVHYNFRGSVEGTPNGAWNAYYFPGDSIGGGMGRGCLPGIMGEHFFTTYATFAVDKVAETFSLSGVEYTELSPGVYRLDGNGAATARVTFPTTEGRWRIYNEARQRQLTCGHNQGEVKKQIGSRSVSFDFTVVGGNNPPATPAISGPTSGTEGQTLTFNISGGTDPDGDQVRYGIANSACTNITQWLPGSGYFTPGTQSLNRTWGTANTYTINVLSEDVNGARSSCGSHTVTISSSPAPTVDLQINGSDGPLNVGKNDTLNLSWTSSNATRCSLFGAGLPGGFVATNGNTSVSASAVTSSPESYTLSCVGSGSSQDVVEVSVGNQAPNRPTINQTAGNNENGSAQTFSFQATDPDDDQIYYEIDWNNDGSVDVATPASSYVNSGTALSGNRTWGSPGIYTFQARTVDFDNARSGWSQFSVTINQGPPPTVNLDVRVNGGVWGNGNVTVGAEDDIDLRWSSSNAATCTASGSGFSTGGSTSGIDNSITTPSAGNSTTFSVNCDGAVGSIVVTSERSNLAFESYQATAGTFNDSTNLYDSVTVRFVPRNTTRSAVPNTTHRVRHDGTNYNGTTAGIAGNEEGSTIEEIISDVPFGPFSATITLDQPNTVIEANESDNTVTVTDTIDPPNPGLFITADRIQVRAGDPVMLEWGTTLSYPMNCTVEGPGIDIDPAALTGNTTTPGIEAKSEYIFTCVEPTTNSNFTADVTIETVGTVEEI